MDVGTFWQDRFYRYVYSQGWRRVCLLTVTLRAMRGASHGQNLSLTANPKKKKGALIIIIGSIHSST
jgi:hypothetical protein